MKKKMTIANKSFMFYMSLIAVFGLLWSCAEEEYNPGIQAPVISEIGPESAFAGQEVIIYGKNFSPAAAGNTVSFNGTAATVTGTTTLAITTTVPVGATSGDVTVSANSLTSAGYPFTITIPVIPTITSIDPIVGKVGQTVTITGTNFSTTPADNVVSFNGVIATVTASTATSITTSVPAGATTGNVTVKRDVESNGIMFTVTLSNILVVQIEASEDDAEEGGINGKLTITSSDLELGEFDSWTQDGVAQGLQTIGLRFNHITIPASSTILGASIQFTADNTGADPVQLTIYGENNSNPIAYSEDVYYDVTNRTKTVENAVWDVPEWVSEGDAGNAQKTVDIASIVQAIVNRGDWASGNSMAFIMEHSGPSLGVTSSEGGREAESADGSSSGTLAAVLTIIYD